jgi:hypothetical protein
MRRRGNRLPASARDTFGVDGTSASCMHIGWAREWTWTSASLLGQQARNDVTAAHAPY